MTKSAGEIPENYMIPEKKGFETGVIDSTSIAVESIVEMPPEVFKQEVKNTVDTAAIVIELFLLGTREIQHVQLYKDYSIFEIADKVEWVGKNLLDPMSFQDFLVYLLDISSEEEKIIGDIVQEKRLKKQTNILDIIKEKQSRYGI